MLNANFPWTMKRNIVSLIRWLTKNVKTYCGPTNNKSLTTIVQENTNVSSYSVFGVVGQPTEMCVLAGRPKDIFGREGEV